MFPGGQELQSRRRQDKTGNRLKRFSRFESALRIPSGQLELVAHPELTGDVGNQTANLANFPYGKLPVTVSCQFATRERHPNRTSGIFANLSQTPFPRRGSKRDRFDLAVADEKNPCSLSSDPQIGVAILK